MKSLLTLSLPVKNIDSTLSIINSLSSTPEIIELRLDYLPTIDLYAIQHLLKQIYIPCIITLRCKSQGGYYPFSEEQRFQDLQQLVLLKPDYLDIEFSIDNNFITKLQNLSPNTKLIKSYHNFNNTPEDLEILFQQIQQPNIYIYKIITTAQTSLDTLRMMCFVKNAAKTQCIVGHCMGEDGMFGRVAGAILGNYFTYSSLTQDNNTAPGMMSLEVLVKKFFLPRKNNQTRLYALLGNPVAQSIGDIFHNQYFIQKNINALYLKIKLQSSELTLFFKLIKLLPFSGFSITMPLKQHTLPFVTSIESAKIKAINTLAVNQYHIYAANTDGLGAIKALQKITPINYKKILLLGAGGTAEAIAYALQAHPVTLTIANRTIEKSKQLATSYQAKVIPLQALIQNKFDIIINTLPEQALQNFTLKKWITNFLSERPILFNAPYNQPKDTLKELAMQYSCQYVSGELMFEHQAIAQQQLWQETYA